MFEHYTKPILTRAYFLRRVFYYGLFSSAVLFSSLGIGVIGYHHYGHLTWEDSLLNASMILTGMGPVNPMTTTSGKLFASFYALFSGIAFLTTQGILLAPMIHRFLHVCRVDVRE